jgi:hypothetical protein
MNPILTIEGVPVYWDGTTVSFTAPAMVDVDGTGPHHGDPCAQSTTSLRVQGRSLNADVDCYVVVPPQVLAAVQPVVLGSACLVTNTSNGLTCQAVVGDVGPHAKIGELSRACAIALGIPSSPVSGGIEDHVIRYEITPGQPADGYNLQPA